MQKKTLYLIGLLALLLLLIYLPDMIPEDRGYPLTLGEVDTAAVTRIEVIAYDEELLLEKEGGELVMRQPLALPLESLQSRRLLGTLADLRVSALTTEKEGRYLEYLLTDTIGIRVRVMEGEQAAVDFLAGKESADQQHSYARLAGSSQILQMSRNLTAAFKLKADNLYRKELYALDPSEIKSITLDDREDHNLSFSLDFAGGNLYVDSRGNSFPADSALVQDYLRQISRFRTTEVVMPAEERDEQLSHQLLAVQLETALENIQLYFYHDPDNEDKQILVTSKYPYRFRVAKSTMERLRRTPEDFIPSD